MRDTTALAWVLVGIAAYTLYGLAAADTYPKPADGNYIKTWLEMWRNKNN